MSLHPPHPASLAPEVLAKQCDVEFLRRSGPGGQHRNKVETAVRLCHRPTGIRAEAVERRAQAENRKAALFRLRLRLALEVRSPVDLAAGPSEVWQSRCRGGRILVNPSHDAFPALLAEALDAIAGADQDVGRAAEALQCTASQLVKLLKQEPRALEQVNQIRRANGQRPLR